MFLDRLPILFTWSVLAIPQSGVIRVDMMRGRADGLVRYLGNSLITLKKSSTLQAGSV